MSFSLPYSRKRRYLKGIDWVVGALHQAGLKSIGIGAVSQAVLELEGTLDERQLTSALQQISRRLPLIHGRFDRDWFNLAPYWKVPRPARTAPIPLRVVDLPANSLDEADRLLAEHVNEALEFDSQHLRFLLVRVGRDRSKLGLVFDHRLFDAFGAESFFRLVDETFQGRLEQIVPKIKQTEPAHLDHWKRRFLSGRMLNRMLIRLTEQDVCALAMPPTKPMRRIRFVHEVLSAEHTARISEKAFEETGMPILLPSAAARAVSAVRGAIPTPALSGSHYLLFTSANMRPPGQDWESVLFNHFSFLLFSAPYDGPRETSLVAKLLRDQLFQHMKDSIPAALEDAAALGRIFPRSLVARAINSMFKGRMCSFYFACLKECGFPGRSFLGLPAVNIVHTPLAFAPPGMNLCMTTFAGRFNLVLSYLEGAMDDAVAREIMLQFKASLVEG